MRTLSGHSTLSPTGATLAIAPALTPGGLVQPATFFRGFATHPRTLAQGLVTLADITATRYFHYTPSTLRDPVLTAHGDRLRAEVFSACNSVYARLDIPHTSLDGGDISYGTTNVDIGENMRQLLSMVGPTDHFHLDVSAAGLKASTMHTSAHERPVNMPDRWVRALGNAAQQHHHLVHKFTTGAAATRAFLATLPTPAGSQKSGWVLPTATGVRIGQRPTGPAVWIDGLHRLSALKRLIPLVQGMTFYGPKEPGEKGPVGVGLDLPGASLFLTLTPQPHRGYSGEGSLLEALATPTELDTVAAVGAAMGFESHLDVGRLAQVTEMGEEDVHQALATLTAIGHVGWDCEQECYFHRELPTDPDRIDKDNPRLVRARKILDTLGSITGLPGQPDTFEVDGGNGVHRVIDAQAGAKCTCMWYLRHGATRGACAHILAVTLWKDSHG